MDVSVMQVSDTIEHQQVSLIRLITVFAVVAGSLLIVLFLPPVAQGTGYDNFADQRIFFGVPALLNVASNLGFLIAGVAGVVLCYTKRSDSLRASWMTHFTGVALISIGSAYYHLAPGPGPLVWDRLPMTLGFMGLVVALLGEYVGERLSILLVPSLAVGAASVVYWYLTGDLRFYIWVQALPLMIILTLLLLFRPANSHPWVLGTSLGFYALAKLAEYYDREFFVATKETVSGHTAKHLLSSAACCAIVVLAYKRRSLV
jgi:hypothetical protein